MKLCGLGSVSASSIRKVRIGLFNRPFLRCASLDILDSVSTTCDFCRRIVIKWNSFFGSYLDLFVGFQSYVISSIVM